MKGRQVYVIGITRYYTVFTMTMVFKSCLPGYLEGQLVSNNRANTECNTPQCDFNKGLFPGSLPHEQSLCLPQQSHFTSKRSIQRDVI